MKNPLTNIYGEVTSLAFCASLFVTLLLTLAIWSKQMTENFFDDHRLALIGLLAAPLALLASFANSKFLSRTRIRAVHRAIFYLVLSIGAVSLLMGAGYLYTEAISRSIYTASGTVILHGETTLTGIFLSDSATLLMCGIACGITFFSFSLYAIATSTGVYAVLPYDMQRRLTGSFPTFRRWIRL